MHFKELLPLKFCPRLFALLALAFVLATIVGTVTHELGHYFAGKYYGFEPRLHYGSVSPERPYGDSKAQFDSLYHADSLKFIRQRLRPKKNIS